MSYDDKIFRELEARNRESTRIEREKFVRGAETVRNNNAANPEDFRGTGIVPDDQIDKDIKKSQQLDKKFSKPGFVASALELVVNQGIDSGFFFSPAKHGDMIESIDTSKYDDYVNRVDTAATIHCANGKELTFALDLYSGDDPEKAMQKIARSSNIEESNLFAGFTEIRYYEDSKGKRRVRNIPRYCIGVDKEGILSAVDTIGGTGNLFQTTSMAEIKFKMLYEMSQQNELYTSYMYEYADNFEEQAENDTDFKQACDTMQDLDNIYLRELEEAKKSLGPEYSKLSIEEIAEQFMKQDSTFETIVEATKNLMEDKDSQEQEKEPQRARQSGKRILEALKRLVSPKSTAA